MIDFSQSGPESWKNLTNYMNLKAGNEFDGKYKWLTSVKKESFDVINNLYIFQEGNSGKINLIWTYGILYFEQYCCSNLIRLWNLYEKEIVNEFGKWLTNSRIRRFSNWQAKNDIGEEEYRRIRREFYQENEMKIIKSDEGNLNLLKEEVEKKQE